MATPLAVQGVVCVCVCVCVCVKERERERARARAPVRVGTEIVLVRPLLYHLLRDPSHPDSLSLSLSLLHAHLHPHKYYIAAKRQREAALLFVAIQ